MTVARSKFAWLGTIGHATSVLNWYRTRTVTKQGSATVMVYFDTRQAAGALGGLAALIVTGPGRGKTIPFGPYMALGGAVAAFAGHQLSPSAAASFQGRVSAAGAAVSDPRNTATSSQHNPSTRDRS